MPRGGKRTGAGRKPKPLSEKLAEGNPGHRPLEKVEFAGNSGVDPRQPPEYLRVMEKREQAQRPGIPTPTELYIETVKYLEPSECLNMIPGTLISAYVMAKYHLLHAQYELGRTATIVKTDTGTKKGDVYEMSQFAEAMLEMQKNLLSAWQPIWDIISRSSTRMLSNPDQDLIAAIIDGRIRKKKPKGDPPDGFYANTEDSG